MNTKVQLLKRIILSVAALLFLVGISGFLFIPTLQIKGMMAITWVRGVIEPSGPLPTAESETPEQEGFWLPDLLVDVNPATTTIDNDQSKISQNTELASTILPTPEFDTRGDYQDWNNCGPATLALALRFWGWQGDQFTISDVIRPVRQDKNVNMVEMADYVNQLPDNLKAEIRVGGDLLMLKRLIAAGFPVVIEESFKLEKAAWPGDDLWAGHYLMLTGFDDQTSLFVTQDSYYGPDRLVGYAEVESAWQSFNNVYLVVFPEERMHNIQNLLGDDWQVDDNLRRTAKSLQIQINNNQGNAFIWFNLGTSLGQLGDYESAAAAFRYARQLGLPQRMLRYQFDPLIAAYETRDQKDLSQLADFALQITPESEEALLWKGWSLVLKRKNQDAAYFFKKALDAHPGYQDAKNALQTVNSF